MKRTNKLIIGLILVLSMSNNAFAIMNTGYVWIQTNGYFDTINYGRTDWAHIPKPECCDNTLFDINSIIKIEAKNRIYWDLSLIQDIANEFLYLYKERKCPKGGGAFNLYMLNDSEECSVDKIIDKVKYKYQYKANYLNMYFDLPDPIRAKVLGYVKFKAGMFILIEQVELLSKDK